MTYHKEVCAKKSTVTSARKVDADVPAHKVGHIHAELALAICNANLIGECYIIPKTLLFVQLATKLASDFSICCN